MIVNMTYQPITLGQLISFLEPLVPQDEVVFDFMGFQPVAFMSLRGNPHELALGYQKNPPSPAITVEHLLGAAREANGREFEGYKGGMYKMSLGSLIWIANRGELTHTALVGIAQSSDPVVLSTGWDDT